MAQTSEQYRNFELPASHLWLRVPLVSLTMAGDEEKGRVVPDALIRSTAQELAAGRGPGAIACGCHVDAMIAAAFPVDVDTGW